LADLTPLQENSASEMVAIILEAKTGKPRSSARVYTPESFAQEKFGQKNYKTEKVPDGFVWQTIKPLNKKQ